MTSIQGCWKTQPDLVWCNQWAHGPTKETGKICAIFGFFRPTQKIAREGPKWGREGIFPANKTLPTFWAERILILRILFFLFFWVQNFRLGPSLGPSQNSL